MIFDSEDNAPEFINILKEGMRKSAKNPVTKEEFNKRVEEEQEQLKEKLKTAIENENKVEEVEENIINKDELLSQIQNKMKSVDADARNKAIAFVKAKGGKTSEMEIEDLKELLNILN
jgi:hypothetical protein